MNYDEEYWRAKAIEAQQIAAYYYRAARTGGTPSVTRAFQTEAYDAHLKALARLGWAEVERNNTRGNVLTICHKGGLSRLAPDDIDALQARYPLNRDFGKMRVYDEAHHVMPADPHAFTKALAKLKRGKA